MPSSDEDLSSFRVGFPSHAGTSSEMLNIRICSVTGQDWTEIVSPIETVEGLKLKIWKRSGLLPCYQRLIFSGENLSSHNNLRHLRDYGIQQDSLIRLMLAPRSGPLHVLTHVPKETSKIVNKSDVERCPVDESYCNKEFEFDEECLKENQRTLYKMCDLRRAMKQNNPITKCVSSFHEKRMISAPEDTSAKESSAGETEFDDDSCGYSGLSLKSDLALSAVSIKNGRRNRQSGSKGDDAKRQQSESAPSARDRLLLLMHTRACSPITDVNTHSEEGSEFSSGMIVCDISNDFRRMRVRRKHHAGNGTYNTLQRTRARSKPRPISVAILRHHKGSDVTSSDDERPSARRNTESALPCSSTRRSTLIPRNSKVFGTYQSHQRCYTCAAKFTSCSLAFQCRCGKTLCTRHRPADMHTCARIRKSQDIGD